MALSALKIGEALARRLNPIVPNPIHVSAEPPSSSTRDADVFLRVASGAEPWSGPGFSNLDVRPRADVSLGDVACGDFLESSERPSSRVAQFVSILGFACFASFILLVVFRFYEHPAPGTQRSRVAVRT